MGLERSEKEFPSTSSFASTSAFRLRAATGPRTIPSETELSEQYGVSRATVRQALSDLVREGLLERRQGFGTIVRDRKITQEVSQFYTFPSAMIAAGHRPTTEVLSVTTAPIDAGTARHLGGVTGEDEVVKVARLRLVDSEPIILESSYRPRLCSPL